MFKLEVLFYQIRGKIMGNCFIRSFFLSSPPSHETFLSLDRVSFFHSQKVRDLSHENLNPFIGACIESPNILLVWSYCKKGSLQVCACSCHMFVLYVFRICY